MAKKKIRKKYNKRKKIAIRNESSEQQPNLLVKKLLERAESCVNSFEYELAQKFLEKALLHEPNNIDALEMLSAVLLELGNLEEASNILKKTVELHPEARYSIYFSLAQLNKETDSVSYYRKGIEIIKKLLEQAVNDEESISLKRELSNAYCSMAEIYMTDCCFEDDAEEYCKNSIEGSIESDSTNPESYQCLANFMLVKGEEEKAKEAMTKSLSLWLPQDQALREGKIDCNDQNVLQHLSLSYDSRINTSKLLIELQMFDEASEVLDGLIDEDDEVVEVWYLLGWSNYLRGQDYWGNARYYLKKTRKIESKVKNGDPDQITHIDELLTELGAGSDSDEESDTHDTNKENENFEIENSSSESENEENMEDD